MKRRDFIKTTAALTVGASTLQTTALAKPLLALDANLKVRVLHLEPNSLGGYTLLSDGTREPRKLVRQEVIDATFGKGSFQALTQPDHWRMIEEGWFADADLYDPAENKDQEYYVWHANYKPECEGHDLLFDLFRDRVEGAIGYAIPDLGLVLGEHPCTPRLAIARLVHEGHLEKLKDAIAERTKWIVIETEPSIAGF